MQRPRSKDLILIKLKIIQEQVGHAYAATTALYTNVSDDFKNRTLAKALQRAFTPMVAEGGV